MSRYAARLISSAVFSAMLAALPAIGPAYAGGDPPASEAPPATTKKKKGASYREDPTATQGYRAAYAAVYERGEFAPAIDQLKALGRDDNAAVANLIGYSYRKLGNYQLSQAWYERALKSDPNHARTWQYYGLWQIEQGNRDQAQYHLSRIASICGTGCEEYRSLSAALEQPPGSTAVY